MIDWKTDIFQYFIEGKTKEGKTVPKNMKKELTYEEAEQKELFGAILKEGFIDISFDSVEMGEKFLKMRESNHWNCVVLENPLNKHIHTIWNNSTGKIKKKSGADLKTSVGLIADIHGGKTYIRLKEPDHDRFPPIIIPDTIDEVPDELIPVNTSIDLMNLGEGDGRNDSLFRYILVLQGVGMNEETIKRILNNTNDFVLSEPLEQNELDTITRSEAFEKPIFFEKNHFLHNQFGDYLKNKYHIKRINGQLSCFVDGCYQSGSAIIENIMILEMPRIKGNQRTEVWKYLDKTILKNERCDFYKNMIAFRNGIFDIDGNELLPSSHEYVVTNQIPFDYNQNAYCELTDRTLNKISCGDESIRKLIEEMIGVCFYRSAELQRSFILTGSGANGKSTLLETIKYLLGEDNVAQLDLCELGERFSITTLSSKLANIGDDISDDFADGKSLSVFKKIATGNGLKAENKGEAVYFFKPFCKMLFSANSMPKLKSGAFRPLKRRLIIVPFNAEFKRTDEDYDRNIEFKLKSQESIEYLIRLGIEGLKRVLENDFTTCQKTEKEMEEFEIQNNPILSWLKSLDDEEIIFRDDVTSLFYSYQRYCELDMVDKCQCLGIEKFSKQLRKTLNLTSKRVTINGKKVTLLVKNE